MAALYRATSGVYITPKKNLYLGRFVHPFAGRKIRPQFYDETLRPAKFSTTDIFPETWSTQPYLLNNNAVRLEHAS